MCLQQPEAEIPRRRPMGVTIGVMRLADIDRAQHWLDIRRRLGLPDEIGKDIISGQSVVEEESAR